MAKPSRNLLQPHDVRGLIGRVWGYSTCRHCVRMLCLALSGRGEYIVPRCPRCGLSIDSRHISERTRNDEMDSHRLQWDWWKNRLLLEREGRHGR